MACTRLSDTQTPRLKPRLAHSAQVDVLDEFALPLGLQAAIVIDAPDIGVTVHLM